MKIQTNLAFWILLFTLMVGVASVANAQDKDVCREVQKSGNKILTSYERRQRPAYTFPKDEGTWVYTSAFREMFGMPCEWVDDGLVGVEGVSLGLVRTTRGRCHTLENGEERCVPSWQWQMEMYFKPEQDLGFSGNYQHNSIPLFNSLTVLAENNPHLRERWEKLFDLRDVRSYLVPPGDDRRGIYIKPYGYMKDGIGGLTAVAVLIDDETALSDPDLVRKIEFRNSYGEIVHRVEIPASYWQRTISYPNRFPEVSKENWSGGREEGDFLWIYTREFAEKYSLSKENISAKLEGALAVAFWIDHYGLLQCGYFGEGDNPKSCVESTFRSMEVYLPENAVIHYVNDRRLWFSDERFKSMTFIQPELPTKRKSDEFYRQRQSGPKMAHMINRFSVKQLGFLPTSKFTVSATESLDVRSFYRPETLNDGFGYFQISPSMFHGDEWFLVFSDSEEATKYHKNQLYALDFHKVKLPLSYREKIQEYIEQYEKRRGSLWKLVEERLK